MEQVSVIAKTSFVNGLVGSVVKNQKLVMPINLANEFVSLDLVEYDKAEKVEMPKKPSQSPTVEGDGKVGQSASLPVETASPTNKSSTRNGKKTGK